MHEVARCFSAILEDLFDDTLLNQVYQKITEGEVQEGMDDLVTGLHTRRQNSSAACASAR